MRAIASQTTSLTIVYSTVYSGVDQRKHQSSASLASNAENVSTWWRHHEIFTCKMSANLIRPTYVITLDTNLAITVPVCVLEPNRYRIVYGLPWITVFERNKIKYGSAWITILSLVRQFGNDFHEWGSHEWKHFRIASRVTKIVIHADPYIILFLTCSFIPNAQKSIEHHHRSRSFRHCRQGWSLMT